MARPATGSATARRAATVLARHAFTVVSRGYPPLFRRLPAQRPNPSVLLDLSALAGADEVGARELFASCRRLRLDGFQVDIHGMRVQERAVLRKLGLSLGRAGVRATASRIVPGDPMDAA